jgi:diguanylate cyclase (GGDEF)-like protein
MEQASEPHPRPSATFAVVVACLLLPILTMGDVVTGADASFTLLYGVSIAIATWFASRRWGVVLSLASAVASLIADRLTPPFDPHLPPGCPTPVHSAAVVYWNVAVQLGTFLVLVALLAALKERLERERNDARTDALTGCSNRRAFFEVATLELERARRHHHPLSLAYVDVDGFKGVNDTVGHARGDALLVAVASTLRAGTRSFDQVARLGGDEFGLLLPETGATEVGPILARLRAELDAAMRHDGLPVGFSIGVVTYLTPPADVSEMIHRADALMYAAKAGGKGTTRFEVAD